MEAVILVVDANIPRRRKLTELLIEKPYRVITASNGIEAINKISAENADLVISAINMPLMDGAELLIYLRNQKPFNLLPFIFYAESDSIKDAKEIMSLGADDFITFPLNESEIFSTVETRLTKSGEIRAGYVKIKEEIALSFPHEFRNPFTPIMGLSNLIIDEAGKLTKNEIKEMAEVIRRSALKLHGKIEKFILYSITKLELNNAVKNDLTESITDNIKQIVVLNTINGAEVFSKLVEINYDVEECRLKIGEKYLALCVKELSENACKFAYPDTPLIIKGERKKNFYSLSFENMGSVINPERIKNIGLFNKDLNPTAGGTGIGLALVKEIIESFGGTLSITSKINGVNRAVLCIPTVKTYTDYAGNGKINEEAETENKQLRTLRT